MSGDVNTERKFDFKAKKDFGLKMACFWCFWLNPNSGSYCQIALILFLQNVPLITKYLIPKMLAFSLHCKQAHPLSFGKRPSLLRVKET